MTAGGHIGGRFFAGLFFGFALDGAADASGVHVVG
jgi:hypothetical protein